METVQRWLCLVIRGHEMIRSNFLSASNKFTQGRKTGATTPVPTKSKLCDQGRGGN